MICSILVRINAYSLSKTKCDLIINKLKYMVYIKHLFHLFQFLSHFLSFKGVFHTCIKSEQYFKFFNSRSRSKNNFFLKR